MGYSADIRYTDDPQDKGRLQHVKVAPNDLGAENVKVLRPGLTALIVASRIYAA